MTDTLRRRGPDDAGYYFVDAVGLGMRRLSIIDIAGGQQPIFSQSGRFVAVFNGEIYNYKSLQLMLRENGFSFQSDGDGEVIVNLYEHCGTNAFNQLRGMFAVAIWDRLENSLLLVRDQLGIKPVFYCESEGSLLFGSEIKSLLEALPGTLTVDVQALDALLAYTYIPAPLSIWKQVRKLRPGHYIKWVAGRTSHHRYWDLLDAAEHPEPSVDEVREALDESVRAHLVSDVEVGAFLSGGLDSSTIVARMQRSMHTKIRAFSVRFQAASHLFDETVFARELRDAYGFELHIEDLLTTGYDSITNAICAFDEPFADDSLMPNDAISEIAAKYLKVVLSGAGGDEIFGGYNRYQGIVVHEHLARLPQWVRSSLIHPVLGLLGSAFGHGTRKGDLIQRFARDLHRCSDEAYLSYITAASTTARQRLLASDVWRDINVDETTELVGGFLTRASRLHPLKRAMYADVNTYLPEDVLALSDRIGMWHSLEIRTPLADCKLAEFAFRLPPRELVTMREKKVALRRAVKSWLPASILSHPKQGFEGPTASWLKAEGAAVVRKAMEAHRLGTAQLVDTKHVESLLEEHVASKADHAKVIFSSFAIAEWTRLNHARIGDIG